MTILTLSDQTTITSAVKTRTDILKIEMDKRLPIWQKASKEKKVAWIKSDKDPIMTLSWQIYRYLRDNFFGEVDNG